MNVLVIAFTALLRNTEDPIKSDLYMEYINELQTGIDQSIQATPERIAQLNQIVKNDTFQR